MAIITPCSCSASYNLKSDFAGQLLQCPLCSAKLRVPRINAAETENKLHVFTNNVYLLRQKRFSIITKYTVLDSDGREVIFVERSAKWFERIIICLLFLVLFSFTGGSKVLILLLTAAFFFINVKRHIKFYDSSNKDHILLEVRQDKWLQKKWIRYTLYDHGGSILGYFEKNRFSDILRRKWRFRTPDQQLILTAQEDSLIASLMRRVTGYFFDFAIFRTNFIFYAGDSEQVVGEFNKKLSIFDRYILDMTPDGEKLIDCRVALALGVLLDTGEGR